MKVIGKTLVAAICVVAVSVVIYKKTFPSAASLLAESEAALEVGKYGEAESAAARLLHRDPRSTDALVLALRATHRAGDHEKALDYCKLVTNEFESNELLEMLKQIGQKSIYDGRATDAEFVYQRALRVNPHDLVVHRRLSALYLGQARRWESLPHLFALLKGKAFTLDELGFLGNVEELYEAEKLIAFFQRSVPGDVTPLMGRARLLLFKSFTEKGEALLRRILEQRPELIEAQAQLGVVLVSQPRKDDFLKWNRQLPEEADFHPEIWWVRATQARREGNTEAAIRCAWEAMKLDPNHLGATYQLAQLLSSEGNSEIAQVFAERASKLEVLATAIHDILIREPTPERMLRCATGCEDLGRLWEAWGWHVAMETYHPEKAVEGERERLASLLTDSTPRTLRSHQLAVRFDFSDYPLPDWNSSHENSKSKQTDIATLVQFENVAPAVGLNFQYENGASPTNPGLMIYQSIGGGVGVIDYDLDGNPDLYFPQASKEYPPLEESSSIRDQLFRNVASQAVRVTNSALPAETGYGFGVAVGDIDGDGFGDLYVANAGRNQLLQNNGDGTFRDVTDVSGIDDRQWTVSTLVADLNNNGLPDLYDVNYCAGERPFRHVCLRSDSKHTRTCIPTEFLAADDRIWWNQGDGRFVEVSDQAGILLPEGRGLGIVAANFDDNPGLDLYVANDMTANYLFLNQTSESGAVPRFEERGVVSGTAYDSGGRPQASMGIAVDDVDRDGLFDLFLTHFYNESNTFYRQRPGRFFVDDTGLVDLHIPSMQSLGFGTQFLDADLDGWPDLVVANGHVDDFTEQDIPFRMRPQFFYNREGEFVELSADRLGSFFQQEQVGRGLARLDWNRDGLDDFVVSRLFDPAALVLNQSSRAGRAVRIKLVGHHYRDAIGAEVRIKAGDHEFVKQLIGGDGFACSNERKLIVGLGTRERVAQVSIRWPGGHEDIFDDVATEAELIFVEGASRPFRVLQEEP